MSGPAPVIVRIRRRWSALLGIALTIMALFGFSFAGLVVFSFGGGFWPAFLGLFVGLCFGGMALFFFGLARNDPVALRMDQNGISGYYVSAATWDEIAEIGTFSEKHQALNRNSVTTRFLGFKLRDPIAFRDRQSPWGRLKSWSSGRSSGFHLVVPETMIKEVTIEALAAQAQEFHNAHSGPTIM